MKTKFRNIISINIHAPTEDKKKEEKENFCAQLERAYDKAPNNDVKNFLGDTTAKIRQEREYYTIIVKHSLHNTSDENGKLLTHFAQCMNMVIRSTQFPRKI
jgi:hypothetical protein